MLPKTKGVKPALPIPHTDSELLVCEQHRREGKEPTVEKPRKKIRTSAREKLCTKVSDPECISPIASNAKTESGLEIPTRNTIRSMLEKLCAGRDESGVA